MRINADELESRFPFGPKSIAHPRRLSLMPYRSPLDWLNFFLADVRGGLGPYLSVFLLTQANWDPATIGAVLTVSGLIGITLHTPIGALIDVAHFKRGLIIVGTCALAVSALAIAWSPTFSVVLTADILLAIAGAIFAPTVAAITLGITQQQALPGDSAGMQPLTAQATFSLPFLAGLVGWALSQRAVFYLVPLFAVLTTLAVLSIPPMLSTMIAREVSITIAPSTKSHGMERSSRTAALNHTHRGECAVPLRKRTHAAAAWTETRPCPSRLGDRLDFSLHHYRSACDDPGGLVGWLEGQ